MKLGKLASVRGGLARSRQNSYQELTIDDSRREQDLEEERAIRESAASSRETGSSEDEARRPREDLLH